VNDDDRRGLGPIARMLVPARGPVGHDAEDRALLDVMNGWLGRIHEMPEDDRLYMLGTLAGALGRRLDDARRLRSAEVALTTIREIAEPAATSGGNDHARGYASAMIDVLAILDARDRPEGDPVILGGGR
jgi:hypothetical protein